MDEIESLKSVVHNLETDLSYLRKFVSNNAIEGVKDDARFISLYSIVEDIAKKNGVSPEYLTKHFNFRTRVWHDKLLNGIENHDPLSAALVDIRSLDEIATTGEYPSIFELPPT